MKKGVTIIGSLILAFAVCVPAFSQPNSKAVETIVIDNFDTDQEWDWDVQTSRFITDGFPLIKKFEGMPNPLKAYHDKDEPGKVLGVKVKYNRKGDNWFEVFPTKGEGNYEIPFRGTVTQIDFWVWGANYNYNLEVLVRDADGRVHTIKAGNLAFQGWRNIVVNVPGYIRQHSQLRSGRPDMTFVGFRIRSDAAAAVDDYVIYFDQLKYTTNFLSSIYDGYELRNMDFGEGESSGKSSSGGSAAGNAK